MLMVREKLVPWVESVEDVGEPKICENICLYGQENVEVFTAKRDPMAILGGLRELLSKYVGIEYQYMNEQLMSQRRSIKRKLPDIQQAKETVTYLKKQKEEGVGEYRCRFPLTDNAHANAKVNPQEIDSVCLWLGANILLEYKLDEATDLLNENDSSARKSLADLEQGIAVVRDQITTTEVNIARVHNFNVKLRSEKRQPQPAAQES
ncbi:Prefoldin subunit 3 [Perkinsus olseni]|uniref:Prefoldin subunit 3 n=1 Tax=Perkinsus olseni TaxID=32597 RepID=A0A7J6KZU6_PEROL|nr:Prefoldin subunit 3 [Perkinsus olseni]KAF4660507.1 Prefoldin subunit 3 [Perkinsus olseni]